MSRFERVLLVLAVVLGSVAFFASRGAGVATATAQADGSAANEIAYVAGYSVLEDLVSSERFAPELADVRAEFEEAMEPLQDEATGLQEEAQQMASSGQMDPARQQEMQREFQRIQQEMQAVQREYQPRIVDLQRTSLQRSWEELRAAAQAVAEDRGFTYVILAEAPTDNLNESGTDSDSDGLSDNPAQEIQKRTVLVAPDGADITADVRADLNLE